VVISAHVACDATVTLMRDVVFGKAARYRVRLCRDVVDSRMVSAPAHVAKPTDMPGARIAKPADVTTETIGMAA
jgi:hypothetical protein